MTMTGTNITVWDQYKAGGNHVFPIIMPSKAPGVPRGTSWQPNNSERKPYSPEKWVFNGAAAIACGDLSGNVECIDYDCKNTTRDLITEFFEFGGDVVTAIYKKLVVQLTVSGGYHFVYRCKTIAPNQKLAVSADGKKALVETRGRGGYFVCAPTEGYKVIQGDFANIPEITEDEREILLTTARALNEYFEDITPTPSFVKSNDNSIRPGDDFNLKVRGDDYLLSKGWTSFKKQGEKHQLCRPEKSGAISGTYYPGSNVFHCFTSSTLLSVDKNYSPFALYTFLECGGDFSEAAKKLLADGYGERSISTTPKSVDPRKEAQTSKHFKDYILKEEPTEEIGIIYISGVNVLSKGNVLVVFGPPKARKTRLAGFLVNEYMIRTAWIDSEQGRMHSWRTGKSMPTADVYHMRGQPLEEITRVVNEIVASGEYELLVIDNIRDLIIDFNDVAEAGKMELFLKRVSEQLPIICIVHENKNSKSPQGHLGYSLAKISQTLIRVHLADIEDPGAGSIVQCIVSRDEPFRQCFFSNEGKLIADNFIKTNGRSMTMDEVLLAVGGLEYSRNELNETFADLFGITPKTAANVVTQIRRAHPAIITERKEGKTKFYNVSSTVK